MSQDRQVYQGKRFSVVRRRVAGRDQGGGDEREVILHPGAVVIVPLVAGDRLCLIRNHRVAVGRTLIEAPAGTLEPGEDPAVAARRELAEETGYRAQCWRCLGAIWMSPGVLCERMHIYVASDLSPGPSQHEADEQIETFTATWTEALQMIDEGRIDDAKTVAALLRYDRLRNAPPEQGAPQPSS